MNRLADFLSDLIARVVVAVAIWLGAILTAWLAALVYTGSWGWTATFLGQAAIVVSTGILLAISLILMAMSVYVLFATSNKK